MSPDDRDEVSRLIFHSTNQYYVSIGREPIFKGDELSPTDIFDVYERIDPGEGIVAVDDQSRQIIGSCFVHPRETHVSLGIMNAHPDHFGPVWKRLRGRSCSMRWKRRKQEIQQFPEKIRQSILATNFPRYE